MDERYQATKSAKHRANGWAARRALREWKTAARGVSSKDQPNIFSTDETADVGIDNQTPVTRNQAGPGLVQRSPLKSSGEIGSRWRCEMMKKNTVVLVILIGLAVSGLALAQLSFTKAQVADRIRKVEDGVDEFRKWSENRAEHGKNQAEAAKSSGRKSGRTATESQKDVAREKKDELDDALGDLNKSTNRLRRKFDPTDKWMETRPQVENVLNDARHINQVLVRGKYGTQAERYWSVLRASINDLARCYNLTPLGV
jgi:hypothetical protein